MYVPLQLSFSLSICVLLFIVALFLLYVFQLPRDAHLISMFHTSCLPSISISAYLQRIAKYSEVSAECLIQAVLHIHRLMQGNANYYHQQQRPTSQNANKIGIQTRNYSQNQGFYVGALNLHRLLLTSIMCTAKVKLTFVSPWT